MIAVVALMFSVLAVVLGIVALTRQQCQCTARGSPSTEASKAEIELLLADYLSRVEASRLFLQQTDAAATYLSQPAAQASYLSLFNAAATYVNFSLANDETYGFVTRSEHQALANATLELQKNVTIELLDLRRDGLADQPLRQSVCELHDMKLPIFQQLAIHSGQYSKHFVMDGTDYLAVTSHQVEISTIYRFDRQAQVFVPFQNITASAAGRFDYSFINGVHYLSCGSFYNRTTKIYRTLSAVYAFQQSSQTFVLHQTLDTYSGGTLRFVSWNTSHYLLTTNRYDNRIQPPALYQFDETTGIFTLRQWFNDSNAVDWDSFVLDGQLFLAEANFPKSVQRPSSIYRLDQGTGLFTPQNSLATQNAGSIRHFVIDGTLYIAAANFYRIGPACFYEPQCSANSTVFRYDATTSTFAVWQELPSSYASAAEYFKFSDQHYLALASHRDGSSTRVNSAIYRWDFASEKFVLDISVPTTGAHGWEFMDVAGEDGAVLHFLVLTAYFDAVENNYAVNSTVYRMEPVCWS